MQTTFELKVIDPFLERTAKELQNVPLKPSKQCDYNVKAVRWSAQSDFSTLYQAPPNPQWLNVLGLRPD